MQVLDPGHCYTVTVYRAKENGLPTGTHDMISFMKRTGPGYPGNGDLRINGTNCQEVLRVLIDRLKYLNAQEHCWHNIVCITLLRRVLWLFERRAAKRHGKLGFKWPARGIENVTACQVCGHILCDHAVPTSG